jgi:molybdate transport system substrate-binding protein
MSRIPRPRETRRVRSFAGVLAVATTVPLALAACSSSSTSSSTAATGTSGASASAPAKLSGQVVVFAATSLTAAFDKIGAQFDQANPGVTVRFNYNGSSTLVTQLKQGAPADVYASANTQNMTPVTDAGLAAGASKVFAKNEAEIMVEPGNPKHITSVKDLSNPAIKVVLCAPEVPCGTLAAKVFKNAGVTVNPVSEETNVGGVVTKVSLGEADAGLVYVTDVKSGGTKVQGVTIPPDINSVASYPIAELKAAPNGTAAAAFISYVLSPAGQKVLASFGFMPPGS